MFELSVNRRKNGFPVDANVNFMIRERNVWFLVERNKEPNILTLEIYALNNLKIYIYFKWGKVSLFHNRQLKTEKNRRSTLVLSSFLLKCSF